MTTQELCQALTSWPQAIAVADAIASPPVQVLNGWDLSNWQFDTVPGAVRFLRQEEGQPVEAVLCLHAPESDRQHYPDAQSARYPTTMLMLG